MLGFADSLDYDSYIKEQKNSEDNIAFEANLRSNRTEADSARDIVNESIRRHQEKPSFNERSDTMVATKPTTPTDQQFLSKTLHPRFKPDPDMKEFKPLWMNGSWRLNRPVGRILFQFIVLISCTHIYPFLRHT